MFGRRVLQSGRLLKAGASGASLLLTSQHIVIDEVQCEAPSSSSMLMTETSTATYNANDPIEDRFLVRNVCLPKSNSWGGSFFNKASADNTWSFHAIFDGHGGWQVAEMAAERLVPETISNISKTSKEDIQRNKGINGAILKSFQAVEHEYLNKVRDAYRLGYGEVAKVGACALLAVRNKSDLYLANCGDCRAVLGSKTMATGDDQKKKRRHVCSRLTRDHNARVPLEL